MAAGAGGIVFLLLIVLIVSAGGSDPEPKSEPSDLGVGGTSTFESTEPQSHHHDPDGHEQHGHAGGADHPAGRRNRRQYRHTCPGPAAG